MGGLATNNRVALRVSGLKIAVAALTNPSSANLCYGEPTLKLILNLNTDFVITFVPSTTSYYIQCIQYRARHVRVCCTVFFSKFYLD